jgi:hypothetical protein
MKVTWTLKNKPSPHIHANATELPQKNSLMRRKFIGMQKEPLIPPGGKPYCWDFPQIPEEIGRGSIRRISHTSHALRLLDTIRPV